MKRMISLGAIAAAVAVAVPATSTAGTDQVSARGGQNFSLTFDIRSSNGQLRAIKNFQFQGFTVRCNQGVRFELQGFKASMAIDQFGEFEGAITEGQGQVFIEGDVRQGGQRTVGSLTASGRFGSARGCFSTTPWEARPTG